MILKYQTRLDLAAVIYFLLLIFKADFWLEAKRAIRFSYFWKRSTSKRQGSHPPPRTENLPPIKNICYSSLCPVSPFNPFSVFHGLYRSQQWV